jgi:hypothetical protein
MGYCAGQYLTYRLVSWIFSKCRTAVGNKPFCLEHDNLHRTGPSEERHCKRMLPPDDIANGSFAIDAFGATVTPGPQ